MVRNIRLEHLCVCLYVSAKCTVAKRLIGSGCRLGGDHRRERGSFGGEFGASRCNQWGLCDALFSN